MAKYPRLTLIGRGLALMVAGFWLGGLTFYAAVVVPTASRVLGSHREAGMITRQVTRWINVIGILALAALLVNALAGRGGWRSRAPLLGTWVVLAGAQLALCLLHPAIDRLLDPQANAILQPARFYQLHRVYLWTSTAQMLAGAVHAVAMVHAWRVRDAM